MTLFVGKTLTITPGHWQGVPAPTLTHQWLANGSPIVGATGLFYVVTSDVIGDMISVVETATNALGSASITSASIGPVVSLGAPVNTSAPVVTGTTMVGDTLSCSTGSWDNMTGPGANVYYYQWKRSGINIGGATLANYVLVVHADAGNTLTCTVMAVNVSGSVSATSSATSAVTEAPSSIAALTIYGSIALGGVLTVVVGTWNGFPVPTLTHQWNRNGSPIGGATSTTYTTSAPDLGDIITCTETATNTDGSASVTSGSIGPIFVLAAPTNTSVPVVSGTAAVGSILSCSTGSWTNMAGPGAATYAYQWKRAGSNIGGATSSGYTLTHADASYTITCAVTATNVAGSGTPATSAATAAVTEAVSNTVAPAVTGSIIVGSTLSTTNGTWNGYPAPSFTYQWRRNGSNIGAATASTYVLVSGDLTDNIDCVVTATGGVTANSNSVGPIEEVPANTSSPLIAGSTTQGSTLTVTPGTWIGSPTPTLTHQWNRNGSPIGGATSTTYATGSLDLGDTITCTETATNAAGSANNTSNGIGPVVPYRIGSPIGIALSLTYSSTTPSAPADVVAPSISGSTVVGSLLTGHLGAWTGTPMPTFAYQWISGGSDIGGATASTYTVQSGDVGKNITLRVTATNASGSASVTSSGVGPVTSSGVSDYDDYAAWVAAA